MIKMLMGGRGESRSYSVRSLHVVRTDVFGLMSERRVSGRSSVVSILWPPFVLFVPVDQIHHHARSHVEMSSRSRVERHREIS
jgi:hypothetical protein